MRVPALLLVCCLTLLAAGCGSDSQTDSEREAKQEAPRETRIEAEQRQRQRQARRVEAEAESEASECDPSYAGACLDPYVSDYDCEGGSGDGPEYTGPVSVVGEDHHGLDSDNDGYACELG